MTDRSELHLLALRLARELAVRAHLRTLLAATGTSITFVRRDLQAVKERMARRSSPLPRTR
jgi:hypothetical protein